MGNRIATEEDYWMCSGGIMPAQMQSVQLVVLQKNDKKYLLKTDTSTASFGDFMCKWVMLIMALIAAVIAVLIVATGGAALGVIIAVGAAAGAAGAVYGSILGSLVCGQKAAIARTWLGEKSNLIIAGQQTLTTGSIMQCPVFGSKIIHAPNVKTWWDALRVGLGNFGETVIIGALGGAVIGVGGAVLSGAAALAMPTFGSVITNVLGSVTGWGMATRTYFGLNAVSNQEALGQIDVNDIEQRDHAFANAAFPEFGSMKRIWNGNPEPMDAMLVLYFLNLRIPGKGSVTPKEEQSKTTEENVKPVEPTKPIEEKPAKGKDGKAYEEGKFSGKRPAKPQQAVLDENGKLTEYGKWYYDRPSWRTKTVNDVWGNAKKSSPNEKVIDPLTEKEITWDQTQPRGEQWHMGHKKGYEFVKHQESAAKRNIGVDEFRKEYNTAEHVQPELPKSNLSHQGEASKDTYYGF